MANLSQGIEYSLVFMTTIAAIATPPGEGGIAIVRLSGPQALEIAERIFSGPIAAYASHTAHLGTVCTPEGEPIDQALALVMHGPRSYTGDDTVEFQCHGGAIAAKQILAACLSAGAQLAGPGEFTFRAFQNGKIDLAQAEAVGQLIGAKNAAAFSMAERHLEGALSKKISSFQEELTAIAAILEAWVDFPEEGLEFCSIDALRERLEVQLLAMSRLLATYHEGKKIHEGISLCLAGLPNVGKSSLMNALLQEERAIVTSIAGTTRDVIEEDLMIEGLHYRLIDTAGLRETGEVIEQEGIRRTQQAMQRADMTLLVLDASRALDVAEQSLIDALPPHKSLLVWNKIDQATPPLLSPTQVEISAKEGRGLDNLKKALNSKVWNQESFSKEEVYLSSLRQKEALGKAIEHGRAVLEGLKADLSPELLTADLRFALLQLGAVIGQDVTEEILGSIFAQFCVGK